MNERRIRLLGDRPTNEGPVLYWMSRDQRVRDNWALLFAQDLALERKKPLGVLFCLVPQFLNATTRQYNFMLEGLHEVEQGLAKANVAFFLLAGAPEKEIQRFVAEHEVGTIVSDFDPLRVKRAWRQSVEDKLKIAFYETDAHNIVPCWLASPKQEIGARTLRPKISRLLPEFLEPFPRLKKHPFPWKRKPVPVDWEAVARTIRADPVSPAEWIRPGATHAAERLRLFIENELVCYDEGRNDPAKDCVSHLSPYLHFGQLSAQRVALEVSKAPLPASVKGAFLEQLVVRRELADNFCYYNARYDSVEGFPGWAQKTLRDHAKDPKLYIYTREQLEHAQTHDELWNAAQLEMKRQGKMHGYMRMYWAKKILEWSRSSGDALEDAIYLNDRYELDGRDPNGYTGIAWSIGGVHDRPWPERPIFGMIRYMSYNGCKSKFDVKAYIDSVQRAE